MKCPNCNVEINKGEKFCKNCGKKISEGKNSEEKVSVEKITTTNPNFKRNNSHPWLIAGICVFLMLIGFIGIITMAVVSDVQENDSKVEDLIDDIKDIRKKEEKKFVDFKNYTFTTPSNVTTSVSGDKLFMYGENNEWVAVVLTQAGKYDTIVSVQDQIKVLLANQDSSYDLTSSTVMEKQYGNRNYLVINNIKKDGYLVEVAYSKADEDNLFIVSSSKTDGSELTESEKETIYNIVSTSVRGL